MGDTSFNELYERYEKNIDEREQIHKLIDEKI